MTFLTNGNDKMKTYTFFKIENGKRKYLKTFFDISYCRNYVATYINAETNTAIKAHINHVFVIVPKHYERKEVWKLVVNQQCTDGFGGLILDRFSDEVQEITPTYETSTYPNKLAPLEYLNGFILPTKYEDYNIFQFNVCETVRPYKKTYYFKKGIDGFIIQNSLVSAENKSVIYLNN